MIIALINWRIDPSKLDDFLDKWMKKLPLNNPKGLIGEFLCKVESADFFDKITWEMEADDRDDKSDKDNWLTAEFVSYVNVGMWECKDDFYAAVGRYMSDGRKIKEPFEAAPRRRALLKPEHWRRGSLSLPKTTSKGVLP